MSFAKLDSGIVDSTLWMQPHDTLRVWIAMLAKADQAGIVRASVPSMAHLCMIDLERMREILAVLEAPDQDSRTEAEEGRRLRKIEGGWEIVNYLKYRNHRDESVRREQQRQWDREHRGSRPNAKARKPSPDVKPPTTPDNPRHTPTQAEAEEEAKAEAEAEKKKQKTPPIPPSGGQPADASTAKPKKPRKSAGITFDQFLAVCREIGEKPIPPDCAALKSAERMGVPIEYVRLAWREFSRRRDGAEKTQKGVEGWRQAFNNCVRGNWFKLWWFNGDDCELTTAGQGLRRELEREAA
jgi:hypothetical protein